MLGSDPRFDIISGRIKDLKEDLDMVKEVMLDNFSKYKSTLNHSICEMDQLKSLDKAKPKSKELKEKL